jgi:hypothetical protein
LALQLLVKVTEATATDETAFLGRLAQWLEAGAWTSEELAVVMAHFYQMARDSSLADELSVQERLLAELESARRLVEALTDEGALALPDEVFVQLLGEALSILAARLDGLTPYLDVARLYLAEELAVTPPAIAAGQLWLALASLDNPAGMVLATAGGPWASTLAQVSSQQQRILDVLAVWAVDPDEGYQYLDLVRRDDITGPFVDLAGVSALANERASRYRQTGLLLDSPTRGLKNTMLASARQALADDLAARTDTLGIELDEYHRNTAETLQALTGGSGAALALQRLNGDKQLVVLEMADLFRTRSLMLERLSQTDDDTAAQMEALLTELQESASGGNSLEQYFAISSNTATISGRDASPAPEEGVSQAIRDVAVAGPFRAEPGSIIRVDVQGQWSPNCALRQARDHVPRSVPIGPEGYTITTRAGEETVESSTHSEGTQWSISGNTGPLTAAIGGAIGFACGGGPVGAMIGGGLGGMFNAGVTQTWSDVNSTTNSESHGTYTSFASGIFLDTTPLRDAPAGSLVLVHYANENTGNLVGRHHESYVVRNDGFSTVSERGGVYYLVVNDTYDAAECSDGDTSPLTVTTQVLASHSDALNPHSALGQRLINGLADGLAAIRAETDELVRLGEIPPATEERLRTLTEWQVSSDAVTDQALTETAMGRLFQLMLARELEKLHYRVSVASQERAFHEKGQVLYALLRQLEEAERSAGYQERLVQTALARLFRGELEQAALAASSRFRQGFATIVDVWYPTLRQEFAYRRLAQQVLEATPETAFLDLARNTSRLLDDVVAAYRTRLRETTLEQWDVSVVVGINRPGSTTPLAEGESLDAIQAHQFWQALADGDEATIALEPELLYDTGLVHNGLSCWDTLPVVHRMGLVFVTNRNRQLVEYNEDELRQMLRVPAVQPVVQTDGPGWVRFLDPTRLVIPSGVLFSLRDGEVRQLVEDTIESNPAHLGGRSLGVSPLAPFTFSFEDFHIPGFDPSQMLGAYLVLLVETDEQHQPVTWLEECL